MSIGVYSVSWRVLAASIATAAVFVLAAVAAWGGSPTVVPGDGNQVISHVWSPDGTYLVVSVCDSELKNCKVRIYKKGEDGKLTLVHEQAMSGRVYDLAFATCGGVPCVIGHEAGEGGGRVITIEVPAGTIKELFPGSNPSMGEVAIVPGTAVGVTPSGTSRPPIGAEGPVFPYGRRGGAIATIEFRGPDGKLVGTPFPVHTVPANAGISPLADIAVTPDGLTYITVGGDINYCIITLSYQSGTWKPEKNCYKLKLGVPGYGVAISPYGKAVVPTSKGVEVIDFTTKPPTSRIMDDSKGKSFYSCVFLNDGPVQTVACVAADGSVTFWNPKTGEKLRSEPGVCAGSGRSSLTPGPGNNEVTVGCADGSVKIVSKAETTTTSASPTQSPSGSPKPSESPTSTADPSPTVSASPTPTPTLSTSPIV